MLIYDLGANDGADTAAYLAAGHEVVAVEANPALADALMRRFGTERPLKRLRVISAAIAETSDPRQFHIADRDNWSSLDPDWAGRNGRETKAVEVACVTLPELFDRYGTPGYLKIDVEGADRIVLQQLLADTRRPKYLSVEDGWSGPAYLDVLTAAGYTGFKMSDQSILPLGTSGPFGDDLAGEWLSIDAMREHYAKTVRVGDMRTAPVGVWYDLHAVMP